jgi:hypothetical protein
MLYNRALTATEVLQNFNAQKGRFGLWVTQSNIQQVLKVLL